MFWVGTDLWAVRLRHRGAQRSRPTLNPRARRAIGLEEISVSSRCGGMTKTKHAGRGWFAGVLFLVLAQLRGVAVELDIPVFSGGFGTAFYEETARLFEQQRPGVKVKLYGDPRIQDKLRVRMIDGDLPDAMFPRDLLIPALARAGKTARSHALARRPELGGRRPLARHVSPGRARLVEDRRRHLRAAAWLRVLDDLLQPRALPRPRLDRAAHVGRIFSHSAKRSARPVSRPVSLTGVYGSYPDAFLRSAYYNLAGAGAWRALNDLAPGARLDPRYERAAEILQRITQRYTLSGWEGATHTAAQLAFLEGPRGDDRFRFVDGPRDGGKNSRGLRARGDEFSDLPRRRRRSLDDPGQRRIISSCSRPAIPCGKG